MSGDAPDAAPELPEPIDLPDRGFEYITSSEGLARAVEVLRGSPVLGVDTEADSFFSYQESCCLLQITGVTGPDYIIDPLILKDLSPLGPLMADPAVVKIFQGADYDVVSMKRDFGFEIRNLFDTMIAAQATGHERFGLGDLVERYFGVKLDKKYQRHDWSSRPLRDEHLSYARLDSHYLPKLLEILTELAEAAERMDMLQEEFALLEQREWTGRPFHPDDFLRLRGASKLPEQQQLVLRKVYALREGLAKGRNRPPFKIWGNDSCMALAQTSPKSRQELEEALGAKHHIVRRYAREVVAAVIEGLADAEPIGAPWKAPTPEWRRHLAPFTRDDEPLFNSLKGWRNRFCKEHGLPPGMIVNNSNLRWIAALKPSSTEDLAVIKDLRRWQIRRFGQALVDQVQEWLAKASPAPGEASAEDESGKEGRGRRRRRRRRPRGGGDTPSSASE